ncbi:hypothetical protein GGF32_004464, partial [Allomyces javanicus]
MSELIQPTIIDANESRASTDMLRRVEPWTLKGDRGSISVMVLNGPRTVEPNFHFEYRRFLPLFGPIAFDDVLWQYQLNHFSRLAAIALFGILAFTDTDYDNVKLRAIVETGMFQFEMSDQQLSADLSM